jgi:hypothetical protein
LSGEEWQGLSVRVRDGAVLGVVVGVFADGPLAGRLRVEGAHAQGWRVRGPRDGVAVYAIPRRAVARRQDNLLLDTTLARARGCWLMHIVQPQTPCCGRLKGHGHG